MMNEIITLCGVEGAVLIFPQAEKPYSFANPSMEKVADRLKNHSRHELSAEDKINNTGQVVEACKNQMIENLFQKYMDLSEELGMEKEKVKLLKESRNEKGIKKMWWNFKVANLTVEQMEQRHQAFVELRNNLCDMTFSLSGKDGDHSSSGFGSGHCGSDEAEQT